MSQPIGPTLMVKDCSVGLARISAMDETGVSAADALSLDCETVHGERVVVLLHPGLAPYIAASCAGIHRACARRRGSVLYGIRNSLICTAIAVLAVLYVLVGLKSGFLFATEAVAMLVGTYSAAYWLVVRLVRLGVRLLLHR